MNNLGLIITVLMALTFNGHGQSLTLMTYNIRYDNPQDGPDNWEYRKKDMVDFITKRDPVIFGIQEGMKHQVEYLDQGLPEFSYFGVGRDDGKSSGEFCAIYYQSDRVSLLESGTFWLSKTPGEVSVGWDAALPRICTYGLFEDLKSGEHFWVFNIHFDHRGISARTHSATLLIDQINTINSQQYPVILMGDFNATVEDKPIQIIKSQLSDSKDISKDPVIGPAGTVNGFKAVEYRVIDFIFCSGFSVLSVEHVDVRTSQGRHLSDHLPVISEVEPVN